MPKPPFKTTAICPEFRYHLAAGDEDIDQLGHVSNMIYLRWVQHAAAAHSGAVGLDISAFKKLGKMFVVREHQITYLQPTFVGEKITLVSWLESQRGASSIRKTRIIRDRDEAELARAVTRWVLVEMESGRPCRIPQSFLDAYRDGTITSADEVVKNKDESQDKGAFELPPIFPDANLQS
jgi:acyl-CoA thioester hydrolase